MLRADPSRWRSRLAPVTPPTRVLPFLALSVLAACAPAPPPAAAPPPASPPAASPPPAPAAEPPSARVTAVAPSKEDIMYVRAKVVFSNPGRTPCRIAGYKLSWAGKSKAITLKDLTVPPGETRERWLRVNPDDGDLAALTPESARVEIQAECAP